MGKTKVKRFYFLLMVLFAFTASCVPKGNINDISDSKLPDTSIVFGRISLTSSDDEVQIDRLFHGKPIVIIQTPNSDIADTYDIKGDGYFFWELPQGEYTIVGFSSRTQGFRIPVRINFKVPANVGNIYIGDIKLNYNDRRYSCAIRSNMEDSYNVFRSRYRDYDKQPIASIAELNESIGSFDKIKGICAPEWGVKCDTSLFGAKVFGVVPINPVISVPKFPVVESDSPTFEWEPSSNNKVTYDLIIYGASSFYFDGVRKIEIPGKIYLYEENIPTAKYALSKKLNKKSKYYWSVRLRENGTVSTWTNFDYHYFYVVGSSYGVNQMFSFSTPE